VPDERGDSDARRGWGWVVLLLVLGALFVGLRGIHALADQPEQSAIFTDRVVVVGVTGRPQLTPTDRAVLSSHLGRCASWHGFDSPTLCRRLCCCRLDDARSWSASRGQRLVYPRGAGRKGDRLARTTGRHCGPSR
jgi:hypothetical protein